MTTDVDYSKAFTTVALLLLAMLTVPGALASPSAVTFVVNSILDQADDLAVFGTCHTADNTCTLRAAVMQANRAGGDSTIMLPSGTYTLSIPAAGANGEENGDLNLTTPASGNPVITITGAGAGTTIIDANVLDRVFHVHPGRAATVSGVTIRNGFIAGATAVGGGIYNEGSLTVRDTVITANHSAAAGGGISNNNSMTVLNSTISLNLADVSGGGIHNSATLTVTNSTLRQNNAGTNGGGITNYGSMEVSKSTISGNGAYDGGGIYNGLVQTVSNSTLSQNSAKNNGGGIYNNFGTTSVYNTSIVFNGADADADFAGGAGGVFNNDTFAATFNLRNTLVAGNNVSNSPTYDDCKGTLSSLARNLFWVVNGCTINNVSGGMWTNLNSLSTVGPLQNNGGPTMTHALLGGSNAIDGGDPALGCVGPSTPLVTDQRGIPRVVGVRCDIGAFEYSGMGIDIDGNQNYEAPTDGLLILRYLFGVTGPSLTGGAIGTMPTRSTPTEVAQYMDYIRPLLDVDGNGNADALTDGLMLIRYLAGLRGTSLISGAIATGAARMTAEQIEAYIQLLMP